MAFLWWLLVAVVGHLVGQEVAVRWPRFIEILVKLAARCLPRFHRAEMEKEWLSIVAGLPGPISKFVQAADFIRAACWLSLQEYVITNRRDWLQAEGTAQVLIALGAVRLLEWVEKVPGAKQTRAFKRTHVGVLTWMVRGFGKHAEAHLVAAECFAELESADREAENRAEGDRIANQVMDRFVDVAIIHAFQEMTDEEGEKP